MYRTPNAPQLTTAQLLENLLPHRDPMVFLSEIVALSNSSATARVVVGARGFSPKTVGGEVCASIALEYLAQTAALTGQGERQGEKRGEKGYLVSVRTFESRAATFSDGDVLHATATLSAAGGSLKTFEGIITDDKSGETIVTATFSIFSFSTTEHP